MRIRGVAAKALASMTALAVAVTRYRNIVILLRHELIAESGETGHYILEFGQSAVQTARRIEQLATFFWTILHNPPFVTFGCPFGFTTLCPKFIRRLAE